ncbi:MAG TPA: hypothetical protein VGY76_03045 [Solirubrobacteraceae bacterium]|jgi:hypothetical protein|nr:hypothetical protein [Solirubrobacteraceae bacterium]
MAYVVPHRSGTWEIRESNATPAGPRSRTLASFRTLTPEVLAWAQARSTKTLDLAGLRDAAARAGAPIAVDAADGAAVELLSELASGHAPRPVLRRLLLSALRGDPGRSDPGGSSNARAAAMWITATPWERGEALRDLLTLTDRLPAGRARAKEPSFPRLTPRAA